MGVCGSKRSQEVASTSAAADTLLTQAAALGKPRCIPSPHVRFRAALFGDSITEWARVFIMNTEQSGWGAMIDHDFARTVDVLNRGFVGYNTRHAAALLPFVFPSSEPSLLFATVWFGANDAVDETNVQQFVPLEEYESNMRKIIKHIKRRMLPSEMNSTIVVLGPPPVDNSGQWSDRSNERMERYSAAAARVAKTESVEFVDVYHGMLDTGNWNNMTMDGLHPNPAGHAWIHKAIMQKLPAMWQSPTWPRSICQDFPFSNNLDPQNPAASLGCDAVSKLSYPVRAHGTARPVQTCDEHNNNACLDTASEMSEICL